MAADEAMLRAAQCHPERGALTRVYVWDGPAVTLGRSSQSPDGTIMALTAAGIEVARRPTGGAILGHGTDVSLSVAVADGSWAKPRDLIAAGRRLAEPALRAVRALGFDAAFRDRPASGGCADRGGRTEALCFLQRSDLDLMVEGIKVAAFAQRRVRGAVLQHGSILVESPPEGVVRALEAAGVGTRGDWERAAGAVRGLAAWKPLMVGEVREALAGAVQESLDKGF